MKKRAAEREPESEEELSEEEGSLGGDASSSDDEEPQQQDAVDFGDDADGAQKLTGRRAKREREAKKKMKAGSFESLGLSAAVLKAIKRKGFRLPTPIQRNTLPLVLQGLDVIGMARTGSGKTAAFVIPMIEKLQSHQARAGARGLLLAPTRELALQTHKAVRELARFTDLRTAVLVGGDALEAQFEELANNPDIIVATPGRLLHHLEEVQGMSLKTVEYCVLDEADRLFEMGFAEQVKDILAKTSSTRQTLLFSATLPRSLADFASAGLNAPKLVRLDQERRISPDLHQAFFTVRPEDRMAALMHIVKETVPVDQLTIVFVSTRHHAEYIYNLMIREGLPAACVFGSMDQTARKIHIAKFRSKKACLLITTDVAARGIDIPLIDNVVNYDFPAKPELFIHRVGRAARMGRSGTAYSLLTRDELPYLLDLQLFLGRSVAPVTPSTSVDVATTTHDTSEDQPVLYGAFPSHLIGPQAEKLRLHEASASELSGAQKTLSNAFSLYVRTRPPASNESVKRAKQMAQESEHPLLLAQLPALQRVNLQAEVERAALTASLRAFRPSATVFEADGVMKSAQQGSTPAIAAATAKGNSHDVMQRKRAAHSATIARERLKRHQPASVQGEGVGVSEDETGRGEALQAAVTTMSIGDAVLGEGKYRDSSLYIQTTKDTRHTSHDSDDDLHLDRAQAELQSAVLDLTAEDQEGMTAQQRRFRWDKRKKKYVQQQGTEASAGQAAKRIKTESGAVVAGGKNGKGLYQKWVKSQRRRVPTAGSAEGGEDRGGAQTTQQLANRFHPSMKHHKWKTSVSGPSVARELKSKDQIRKERVVKDRRKAHVQQRQAEKRKSAAGGKGKPSKRSR